MKSEVSISLNIIGEDLDPDSITEKIGIEPSSIWRKGELIDPRAILRYKENGWGMSSPLKNSNDLEDLTRSLLEKLSGCWDKLTEICSNYYTELSCVIYVSDGVPAIHFEADILEKLNQLNAAIDVDLYVLTKPTKAKKELPEDVLAEISEANRRGTLAAAEDFGAVNRRIAPLSDEIADTTPTGDRG
jgi:hypothetical protein